MITGISIVSVWVLDQDAAKEFYAGKLGFTVTNDISRSGPWSPRERCHRG